MSDVLVEKTHKSPSLSCIGTCPWCRMEPKYDPPPNATGTPRAARPVTTFAITVYKGM